MEDPVQSSVSTESPVDVIATASQQFNATASAFKQTTEGMACAYISIMAMALLPIVVGSFKSIKHQVDTHAKFQETGEQVETMTVKDAAMFPLIASAALLGFYLLTRFVPDLINPLITIYFFVLGVLAIHRLIMPATDYVFPKRYNTTRYTFLFGSQNIGQKREDSSPSPSGDADSSGKSSPSGSNDSDLMSSDMDVQVCTKFTHSDILAFILSGILGVWYLMSKHWVANNAFGLAFALNGIELIPINTIHIGCMLLCGLFFYDVFWVFGTNVMVSVAKSFDAPIKIIFPQDFLENGLWGKQFAMLGLGDIVIPGVFIAFLLRFDHSLKRKHNVYFWSCFIAYIFGLGLTIGVMAYFKHAQPALLYLVPCCILVPAFVAVVQGDVKALLNYSDHPEEATADDNASSGNDESNDEENTDKSQDKKSSRTSITTRANSKKDK